MIKIKKKIILPNTRWIYRTNRVACCLANSSDVLQEEIKKKDILIDDEA